MSVTHLTSEHTQRVVEALNLVAIARDQLSRLCNELNTAPDDSTVYDSDIYHQVFDLHDGLVKLVDESTPMKPTA
jgi:hypothetical protein